MLKISLRSKAIKMLLWPIVAIIAILILTIAPTFIYTSSIVGLGGQGDSLTERSISDMEKFLDSPSICKSKNIDKAALDVISTVQKKDLVLVVKSNALPKRIDFYVRSKSTQKVLMEIIYEPSRGCDGIFLTRNLG